MDIQDYFAYHDRDDNFAYFYFSVEGVILAGHTIPKAIKKVPSAPSIPGPPGIPPPRKGEDIARIYMDSNSSVPSTCFVDEIFADALIEIRGKHGEIRSHTLYLCQGGSWTAVSDPASESANDRTQVEISMSLAYTPDVSNTKIVFTMTDWKRDADNATLETSWGTRSRTRAIYTVESTTSSFTTTAYSTQRKLVHDGTYFWAFYYDGTAGIANTTYEYSDDGEDWGNTPSNAFTTSGVNYASVWLDSANSTIYIVGDTSAGDSTVITRQGTILGTEITWSSEYTVTVSGNNLGSKVAFISRSSTGYIWIASSCQETGYNIAGVRSTNPDDVSVWDTRTVLRTAGGVSNNYVFPQIVPLLGGDMHAVWYADSNIEGRGYVSGSWESNEVGIATTTASEDRRGPSVVANTSQVLHLIYSDSNGYIQHMYKETSGSWMDGSSDPETGNPNNFYPTLSLLTTNDDLYAFYVRGNQIYCQVWDGDSWTEIPLTSDPGTKTNLVSIYSVSSTSYISWEWLKSTGTNDDINFERIPEFQDILAPITFILLIPIALRRRKK
jgi:hypothetical protein